MSHELAVNQEHLLQARKWPRWELLPQESPRAQQPHQQCVAERRGRREDYKKAIDADGQEMIDDIMQQAERASDIVRNLLDFSRTGHPPPRACRPPSVVGCNGKPA